MSVESESYISRFSHGTDDLGERLNYIVQTIESMEDAMGQHDFVQDPEFTASLEQFRAERARLERALGAFALVGAGE